MNIGFMATYTSEEEERLSKAGCQTIIVSASSDSLKEFRKCLSQFKEETVVITDFTSISPTINAVQLAHLLNSKGMAELRVLDQGTEQPLSNSAYLEVVKHVGNLELKSMRERTIRGLNTARSRGVELGRPKTSPDVISQIQFLYHSKRQTLRVIAETCNVSLGTAYKYAHSKDNLQQA